MTNRSIPAVAVVGLVFGALVALVTLGVTPTLQAKRALIDAAGPYALAAIGIALLAFIAGQRGTSGRRHR